MKSQKSKTDTDFPLCKKKKQKKKKRPVPGQMMKKSEHLFELAAPESDQSRELGAKGIILRLLKEAAGLIQMKKKCVFYKHA